MWHFASYVFLEYPRKDAHFVIVNAGRREGCKCDGASRKPFAMKNSGKIAGSHVERHVGERVESTYFLSFGTVKRLR